MNNNLLTGKLTSLVAADPDTVGERIAKWWSDSEFSRLFDLDSALPRNTKRMQEQIREYADKQRLGNFPFLIRCLSDERIIGQAGLWDAFSPHQHTWVSIGIGERELWGEGCGSDAMQLLLGFAFRELNLHRVNLGTFGYNPRAIRAYVKVGFVHEGALRASIKRDGERWQDVFMGILRSEWEAKQND